MLAIIKLIDLQKFPSYTLGEIRGYLGYNVAGFSDDGRSDDAFPTMSFSDDAFPTTGTIRRRTIQRVFPTTVFPTTD